MKILLGTAAIALMLGAGTAFATDDDKTYPGTACVPAKANQASDFKYSKNGIKYTGSGRGTVDCHLLRERLEQGAELASLTIYVNKASGGAPEFSCQVSLRNLTNGSLVDSRSGFVSAQGNGSITMPNLPYSGTNQSLNVRCKVPSGGRIHGIKWNEENRRSVT